MATKTNNTRQWAQMNYWHSKGAQALLDCFTASQLNNQFLDLSDAINYANDIDSNYLKSSLEFDLDALV